MAESAVYWPVVTSWNFLYPPVGGNGKQKQSLSLISKKYQNAEVISISLLSFKLLSHDKSREDTEVEQSFQASLSLCAGEKRLG